VTTQTKNSSNAYIQFSSFFKSKRQECLKWRTCLSICGLVSV